MKIQKGKRVRLPKEDANEIWDITFSITNNELVPLSTEDFWSHVSYFWTISAGNMEQFELCFLVRGLLLFFSASNLCLNSKITFIDRCFVVLLNKDGTLLKKNSLTLLHRFDVGREKNEFEVLWFCGSGLNGTGRCVYVVTASDSVIKAATSAAFGFVSVCEPKSWCWTNACHRLSFHLPGGRAATSLCVSPTVCPPTLWRCS